ncbi:uncharacterized protein LOC123546268 [Mercenaria mercenaria]|uniref:uncharacterized protein LOC123546268 n=1 Tax=Mercenaria mercenaria TaxID=6596 RepID=UPI00234EB632|nr:uncharacterized protein LOC123546268 [Mercenaria mercenaria]
MTSEKDCGLCKTAINVKSSYRKYKKLSQETKTFLINCGYTNVEYVCSRCFYRLTRVDKTKANFETELSHFIIKKRETPSKNKTSEITVSSRTPSKPRLLCKRKILSTPPRQLKKLKPDTCRTEERVVGSDVHVESKSTAKKQEWLKRGRRLSFTSDSYVQISIKTSNGQIKNSRVVNKSLQTVCSAIANKRSVQQICKTIFKEGELRNILQKLFLYGLALECREIVKKSSKSDLQSKQPIDLVNINLEKVEESWLLSGSLLVPTLAAVAGKADSQKLTPDVIFSGASLLRSRNQGYSLLHHAVGLLLDHGGATDKTIEIGQKLGICVAPNTVYAKKRELASFHSAELEDSMQVPVKKVW